MSIKNQLKNVNIKKIKMSNGKTMAQNLYIEAQRLRDCIQSRLDDHFTNYTPIVYGRTGWLENSLNIDDFVSIRVVGTGLEVRLFLNILKKEMLIVLDF